MYNTKNAKTRTKQILNLLYNIQIQQIPENLALTLINRKYNNIKTNINI